MAANKFLYLDATGNISEKFGTQTSAGAADAGKVVSLDDTGKLSTTLFPTGFGSDSQIMTAGENLSAGNVIYVDSAGLVFKADATNVNKRSIGFILTSALLGASVTVYFEGQLTGLSGLTIGAQYYLSDVTIGGVALYSALTKASGSIAQMLGVATSATALEFEAESPIKFA